MTTNKTTIIAIAGGHASGKKTVQRTLRDQLLTLHPVLTVHLLHLADFPSLKADLSPDPERLEAFDLDALHAELLRLKHLPPGGKEERPNVIIAEGPYLLRHSGIVETADINIFVDCDADVRLARRVMRDLEKGNIPLDAIFEQHVRYSKRNFEMEIAPTKVISDIILPATAIEAGVELVARGVIDDVVNGGMGVKDLAVRGGLPRMLTERELWASGEGLVDGFYDTV